MFFQIFKSRKKSDEFNNVTELTELSDLGI